MNNIKWIEAWIDSCSGEYVLLVRETESGEIEIVDPQKEMSLVSSFPNYEEALHWLNEDEYDLMEGRYTLE